MCAVTRLVSQPCLQKGTFCTTFAQLVATIIFVAFPLLRLWLVFWVGWAPTPGRDLVGVCSGRSLALSPSAPAAIPVGIRVNGLFPLLRWPRSAFRLPGFQFPSILAPFHSPLPLCFWGLAGRQLRDVTWWGSSAEFQFSDLARRLFVRPFR